MKIIHTNTVLKNFKDEPLKLDNEELTVGAVISSILGGKVSNQQKGWELGKKFATQDTVELKAEDVVFIQKELESQSTWNAIVSGQVIEILEGNE